MNIEHAAYSVIDPVGMAQWLVQNMGMKVLRKTEGSPYAYFLADSSGQIIEIYNNPKAPPPDYNQIDPLILHLAFHVENVTESFEKLKAAGAAVVDAPYIAEETGDELAMLRDPWGFPIQLVKRSVALGSSI